MKKTVFILALILSFSAFAGNVKSVKWHHTLARVSLDSLPGLWKQDGNGNMLEITSSQANIYEISSQHCLLVGSYDLEDLSEITPYVLVNADKTYFKTDPNLNVTENHSYGYFFQEDYPDSCKYGITEGTLDPLDNFNVFWHTLNENYAYFEERGVDWEQQYHDNLWRVEQLGETKEDQLKLYEILAGMVLTLDRDGHSGLTYIDQDNPEDFMYVTPDSWRELQERLDQEFEETYSEEVLNGLFENQTDYDDYDEFKEYIYDEKFLNEMFEEHNEIISEYMQVKPLQSAANNNIRWGIMRGNVGYIQVLSMYEFSEDDEASADETYLELKSTMDRVMQDLKNTESMVVDVRLNEGGVDSFGHEIASRFYDRERKVFDKKARSGDTYVNHVEISQVPAEVRYVKPVYVLASAMTSSAAEVFTQTMRTLPYVKVIGEDSNGIFSDALSKTLPNGWEFGLSHEVYYDINGESHEYVGIIPDQKVLMMDINARKYRQDAALEVALQMAESKKPAACEYELKYKWRNYFLAQVRITNVSSDTISGWGVNWDYDDASDILFYWNTNLKYDGDSYSASHTHRNKRIRPGRAVTFGVFGSHDGETGRPIVAGEICN